LKAISGKRFVSILEKNGWKVISIKGSHYKLSHPLKEYNVIVPVHSNNDLPIGLLKKLLSESGLTDEDL